MRADELAGPETTKNSNHRNKILVRITLIEEAYQNVKNQVGPCGITCRTCPTGNGTIAETAKKANEFIKMWGIKDWLSSIPGGSEIQWSESDKALDWVTKYAICPGCEQGGGPPDCAIKNCQQTTWAYFKLYT